MKNMKLLQCQRLFYNLSVKRECLLSNTFYVTISGNNTITGFGLKPAIVFSLVKLKQIIKHIFPVYV